MGKKKQNFKTYWKGAPFSYKIGEKVEEILREKFPGKEIKFKVSEYERRRYLVTIGKSFQVYETQWTEGEGYIYINDKNNHVCICLSYEFSDELTSSVNLYTMEVWESRGRYLSHDFIDTGLEIKVPEHIAAIGKGV